jgi:regulatory protein
MDIKNTQGKDSDDALQKLRHFCSFQERCTSEVEEKLVSLHVPSSLHEAIIDQLRNEKFLDDRRFATAFSRGKFRINKWGRRKIRFELSTRGLPEAVISLGLGEIDEVEYMETLQDLITKKAAEIKGGKNLTVRNKIFTFVSGKGYESDLINEAIKQLNL